MITILYSIIMSIIRLKTKSYDNAKELARYICELIIAICLGIGYGVWIVISIVDAHIVDPEGIVAFLIAQETVVSGCLIALRSAVDQVMNRSKSKNSDDESPDDSDEADESVSE